MTSIFVVQHVNSSADGQEDVKFIGVYRSLDSARAAVERLKNQPGFRDFPHIVQPLTDDKVQGFHIDEYTLDKDHWMEGFIA